MVKTPHWVLAGLTALALVGSMAFAGNLDFNSDGPQNQNEQTRPSPEDPNAFINTYKQKVNELMNRNRLDPVTGQPVPTQILRSPNSTEIPVNQSPAATKAGKTLAAPPGNTPCSREGAGGIGGGCLEGATGSLEEIKKRLEDLAAQDPAHAQSYKQSVINLDRMTQGWRTAKANKVILIAAPVDGDAVAQFYSKVDDFWRGHQKDMDVEAYVVCQGPAQAMRYLKDNWQEFLKKYSGGLPFPLQVVSENASPKDVDLRRLPAVVMQGGSDRAVVYDMDKLAQAWEEIHQSN